MSFVWLKLVQVGYIYASIAQINSALKVRRNNLESQSKLVEVKRPES